MQKHERLALAAAAAEASRHGGSVRLVPHSGKAHMRIELLLGDERETLTVSSSPRGGDDVVRNTTRQAARRHFLAMVERSKK